MENKKYESYFNKEKLEEGTYDRNIDILRKSIATIISAGSDGARLPENMGRDVGAMLSIEASRFWGKGNNDYKDFVNGIISSL